MKFEISKIFKTKGYILEDYVGTMHFQNFKKDILFWRFKALYNEKSVT